MDYEFWPKLARMAAIDGHFSMLEMAKHGNKPIVILTEFRQCTVQVGTDLGLQNGQTRTIGGY